MTLSTCDTHPRQSLDTSNSAIAARYAEFRQAWRQWKQKTAEIQQLRARTANEVGLPCGDATALYEGVARDIRRALPEFLEKERREAELLEARGLPGLLEQANAALEHAGGIANEIFAMPAASLQDLAVKLRIMRDALGQRGAQEDGDEDLDAFQDAAGEPWFDSVMRDMARLTGGAGEG